MGQSDNTPVGPGAMTGVAEATRARAHELVENNLFGNSIVATNGDGVDLERRIAISFALFKLWCRSSAIQYGGLLFVLFDHGTRTTSPTLALSLSSALLAAFFADIAGWQLFRDLIMASALARVALQCVGLEPSRPSRFDIADTSADRPVCLAKSY